MKLLPADPNTNAFHVVAETRAFLAGHGISLTGKQQAKTRRALEHFSRLHTSKAA